MRRLLLFALALVVVGLAGIGWGVLSARADPVVRRAEIALPRWPAGAPPIRVVLISDVHIGTIAMDAGRLARIVGQVNALHPDLVLIAGDLIYGHDPRGAARLGPAMVAPLKALRGRLGVVAVPGNHDHWTGIADVRAQLAAAGVTVIENEAIRRGPLVIGAIGDDFSGHDDLPATLRAMRRLPGAPVVLTHSPDVAPQLPPGLPLLLAGHTHCGQAVIPGRGPVLSVSRYGDRYQCGLRRELARLVVVTAGLGTSGPPMRYFAPPDLWLLTLHG